MDTSLYISAGALQTFQKKVDTVSNNVANVNTNGFKRKEATFSEVLANQMDSQLTPDQDPGRLTPRGLRVGYGTRLGLTQVEMDQGQAIQTGNPYDLMIKGKGLFQIGHFDKGKNDPASIRYTRDGAFQLSPDPKQPGSYHLVHQNGGFLLDDTGNPITLSSDTNVQINENGEILLKDKNGQTVSSNQRIGLVDIQNPHVLQSVGDNEFEVATNVLARGTTPTNYVRIMQPGESQISSGFLEGSNVDLTKEMTDLMVAQRGFQLNSRAVGYADQMMGITNSILK